MAFSSWRTFPGHSAETSCRDVLAGQLELRPAESLAVNASKLGSERRNVLAPIPEWRDHEVHHRQPEVEILAKSALLGVRFQVAIGTGDDPDVDPFHPSRSHRLDLALLQRAEQHGLEIDRKLSDLVEDQGSPVRLGEEAGPGLMGAGERTAGVPEELCLRELARNRRAVEADQRTGGPPAVRMEEGGDHLLARPGFTTHQNGDVPGSDPLDLLEQPLHRL